MEDLKLLQRRWEEAYEAMPKLYETPDGLIINFTLSEDTCRRKNKISIWKNKTSIKVEILFFYKP
ncbi:hypothetical protein FU407_04680 [Campylobacter jejuni]|nr:hypothetical protein [Campylobacter jejuni]